MSRRNLLGSAGALISTTRAGQADTSASRPASKPAEEKELVIPTNVLGRTGIKVTRLGMGAGFPSYHPRLLEHACRNGIRYFDNAYGYGNGKHEQVLGKWLKKTDRRDDVIVVTKAGVTSPDAFYDKVVRALENLEVDTVDLMLVHGLDDPGVVRDFWGGWRRLRDRLVREKKVRFMGFSTHATPIGKRVECVKQAADSKWVDVVMLACDPLLLRTNDDLNRAVDDCVKARLGMLAMKTTRGLGLMAARRRGLEEGEAETEEMPGFSEMGLSGFGAIHYGMWSDGRFAAVCSAMLNRRTIDENTRNARQFDQPLDQEKWRLLEKGMKELTRATCPGCDGSCQRAAGTQTDFCSITRYLAYAEEDGNRQLARWLYRQLPPEKREWTGADLAAASKACRSRLDFRTLLARARDRLT